LLAAGEPQRVADEVAPAALALAEHLADHARASRACQPALKALINYGWVSMLGTPEYRQWAERADRYAAPATTDRVHADIALADVRFARGEVDAFWALRWSALTLARELGDPETLFEAAYEVFNTLLAPEHRETQYRLVQEVLALPRAGVSARTLCRVLLFGG